MVLEAVLLMASLVLAIALGPSHIGILIIWAVIVVICLPVIRLVMQGAPPFVPTSKKTADHMIELAVIKRGDTVYDLGCGDGRLLIAAAEKGAVAVGYELSVPTLLLAKWKARRYKTVEVRYGDFWQKDFSDADVIVCYLLIQKMKLFKEVIWPQLKPGTRVVSHSFKIPGIKPTQVKGDAVLYVK